MILLDTNVVSELMRPSPGGAVIDWLNATDTASLHISCITIGEIEYGLDILPDGRRQDALRARFEDFVARAFAFRVLPYDESAARLYGGIMGDRRRTGRPMSVPDAQIAALARSRNMAVATRDVAGFADTGIDIINLWRTR